MKLIGVIVLSLVINVWSWTVRLEDMKLLNEENPKNNKIDVGKVKSDKNKDIMNKFKYAEGYEYQAYKEMQVSNVIRSGSIYLEGLSRALLDYRQMLEACGSNISTTSLPENSSQTCITAAEDIKLVQRLSELALETTRKLRDKGNVNKDDQSEENELILQLAWFLDQLAKLTGFKQNDKISTDIKTSTEKPQNANVKDSLELLETVENGRPMSKLPTGNVKSVVKRSTAMAEVVKYYNKYKIWTGSNSNDSNNFNSNYDVGNDLHVKPISKRSIPNERKVQLRISKKKISKVINISKLFKNRNVFKVVVVKKLKNKY